jgi:uncharacterized coiled-coil protein SlyX
MEKEIEQIEHMITKLNSMASIHRELMEKARSDMKNLAQKKLDLLSRENAKLKYGPGIRFYDKYINPCYPHRMEEYYKGYLIRVGYPSSMGGSGYKHGRKSIARAQAEIEELLGNGPIAEAKKEHPNMVIG